jgi:hypothetical protein
MLDELPIAKIFTNILYHFHMSMFGELITKAISDCTLKWEEVRMVWQILADPIQHVLPI